MKLNTFATVTNLISALHDVTLFVLGYSHAGALLSPAKSHVSRFTRLPYYHITILHFKVRTSMLLRAERRHVNDTTAH